MILVAFIMPNGGSNTIHAEQGMLFDKAARKAYLERLAAEGKLDPYGPGTYVVANPNMGSQLLNVSVFDVKQTGLVVE